MTIIDKKDKIQSIVNVFETGSVKGNYGAISIFKDGPNNIRQITYGKSQTTEWGLLKFLVKDYIDNKGEFAKDLIPYANQLGKISLVTNRKLIEALKKAGTDPIMVKTQDEFFDKRYWQPAVTWAETNKFVLPLSGLVIYDSFIHSGSILSFLRNRFPESPPVRGGEEKVWIEQYLNTRKSWLETHSRPILRKTVYRVNNMLAAIKDDNWNLDKVFNANGIKVV